MKANKLKQLFIYIEILININKISNLFTQLKILYSK